MISAIAIDDEPLALEVIESFCTRIELIKLERIFTKVTEAQRYLRKFPVDLLLLDINMPLLSGIDFFKKIEQDTMVIFTTAYPEHAIEGFNLNAIDYILKPYSFDRFQSAIHKAQEYYDFLHNTDQGLKFIYIKADYSLVKIELSEIIYIEALADYLKIFLPNKKFVLTRMTMKSMIDKLPKNEFVRVHRSFIIPLKKIISIRNKTIQIENKEIPLGTSYEDDLFKIVKA